jgi:hypothetical protein
MIIYSIDLDINTRKNITVTEKKKKKEESVIIEEVNPVGRSTTKPSGES